MLIRYGEKQLMWTLNKFRNNKGIVCTSSEISIKPHGVSPLLFTTIDNNEGCFIIPTKKLHFLQESKSSKSKTNFKVYWNSNHTTTVTTAYVMSGDKHTNHCTLVHHIRHHYQNTDIHTGPFKLYLYHPDIWSFRGPPRVINELERPMKQRVTRFLCTCRYITAGCVRSCTCVTWR